MANLSLCGAALACAAFALATPAPAYDPMRPAAVAPAPLPGVAPAKPAVATNPEYGDLPDAAGMEEVYFQCVACHSTAIIRQQALTDARWDYLWDWMVEEQGMYEPDAETRDVILTYLKTHFSSER